MRGALLKKKIDRWVSAREATAILRKNSGRDDIPDTYIRTLVREGKVEARKVDGRTNEYRLSDVEGYVVQRRDRGKGTDNKEEANV